MILETERLVIRHLTPADGPFVLELLNTPGWLRYIGDRGVRTLPQAGAYLEDGPLRMYERYGYGLYCVELKASHEPIGMCGLLTRDFLDASDIGFAFFERYHGQGYALEAATAVLRYAAWELGMKRLVAITAIDNQRSARLLEKLGFRFEGMVINPGTKDTVRLFGCDLATLHTPNAGRQAS